jgi:spore maturation protein CgeB
MVGSYFPDGIAALDEMLESGAQVKTFYDIDTPITIRALKQDAATDYLLARQLPELDIYFSFTGGPMLGEIENDFGAGLALPLYCSVDPKRHHPLPPSPDFACDLSYMGTYAPDRQPKVDDLLFGPAAALPERRFIVAGPQYPDSLQWPGNVKRITHLNPVHHALFYSSSRMTLNVTRREMVMAGFSPSVRLFEAAACGAAIISDNWPGLETFFTSGKEILLPADGRDVARYILNYSERELKAIGQAARERVLAAHTNDARAAELERAVQLVASRAHIKTKNPGTKVLETNL